MPIVFDKGMDSAHFSEYSIINFYFILQVSGCVKIITKSLFEQNETKCNTLKENVNTGIFSFC